MPLTTAAIIIKIYMVHGILVNLQGCGRKGKCDPRMNSADSKTRAKETIQAELQGSSLSLSNRTIGHITSTLLF